ncbi:MAG: hypothetical protein JXA15_07470 [Spirochaetales bacterium]|nr:hypothetical protein [Spirochaetales bacterium]
MPEPSAFDDLVRELSHDERRDLLHRIRGAAKVSEEVLFRDEEAGQPAIDYAARYRELGLIGRILVALRSFFSGLPRDEVLKARILEDVARRVELRSPGLADARRGVLLERFAVELASLRDGSRWFVDYLDRALEKDKGSFYAFVGSVLLEGVHRKLWDEADPFAIANRDSSLDEAAVKATVWSIYEDAVASIGESDRRQVYADLRSLLFLRRLATFLFDRALAAFETDAAGRRSAVFPVLKDQLAELASILASMAQPPSLKLMESLLVFATREGLSRGDFDVEGEVAGLLEKADMALSRVRAFNQRVPLVLLVQLASEDPNWRPREAPGAEDWFALYRQFWRERLERRMLIFSNRRKAEALFREVEHFAGQAPAFDHINVKDTEHAPGIRIAPLIAFLAAFYRNVFVPLLNKPLRIVLLDGEFYKKDNRVEYTEAYNVLLRIDEVARTLDRRLSPGGELSESWIQARTDMGHPAVRHRRIQGAAALAAKEAEDFVDSAVSALRSMAEVLRGIMTNEVGGKYDSLANLHYLEGRANKEFLESVEGARSRIERALSILDELSNLELGGGA